MKDTLNYIMLFCVSFVPHEMVKLVKYSLILRQCVRYCLKESRKTTSKQLWVGREPFLKAERIWYLVFVSTSEIYLV